MCTLAVLISVLTFPPPLAVEWSVTWHGAPFHGHSLHLPVSYKKHEHTKTVNLNSVLFQVFVDTLIQVFICIGNFNVSIVNLL